MAESWSTDPRREVVSVISCDLERRQAMVVSRTRNTFPVDFRYSVGEVDVVPRVGEQWYVERVSLFWRLVSRVPFQYPALAIRPVEGQVRLGSGLGPVELVGTEVNCHGPLQLPSYSTEERPDADAVAVGSCLYDTTLGIPVWSDGSAWKDATGTPV